MPLVLEHWYKSKQQPPESVQMGFSGAATHLFSRWKVRRAQGNWYQQISPVDAARPSCFFKLCQWSAPPAEQLLLFSQPVLLGAEKLSAIDALLVGCVIAVRKALPRLRQDVLTSKCQIYFQALF